MHRRKAILLLLAACGFVLPAVGTLRAQQDEPQAQSPSEAVTFLRDGINSIKLTEQASRILEHSARIKSVDGHDPKVLDVQALSTTQIRMHGLATGVTDLIVTDEFDKRFTVEVFVAGDVRHLKTLIKRLYPQSSIDVIEVKGSVILNGWMTQPEQINEVVAIAENFYDKVLNHMKVGGVQQVMLECQILEVQRSKMRRFGVNFLLNGEDANFASTVGSLAGITGGGLGGFAQGATGLGDSNLSFGLFNSNRVFQGFVQALREEGMLKLQSVPSIVTTNGAPATILSGGEVPIVVPAGLGTVAIEFRSFGIQMDAVPIILGNGRVRLKLRPEVSERDFSSAVTVDGIAVPGFTVRRAETQVEMQFGQTLAIGGLVSRRETATTSKVPLFGELPWLGTLFSRKTSDWSESELIILVTPQYASGMSAGELPPGGPGMFTDSPTDKELIFHQMIEIPKYGDDCESGLGGSGFSAGGYGGGVSGGGVITQGCGCSKCQSGGIGCTSLGGMSISPSQTLTPSVPQIPSAGVMAAPPASSGQMIVPAPTYQTPMQSAPMQTAPRLDYPASVPPVPPQGRMDAAVVPPLGEESLPGLIPPGA